MVRRFHICLFWFLMTGTFSFSQDKFLDSIISVADKNYSTDWKKAAFYQSSAVKLYDQGDYVNALQCDRQALKIYRSKKSYNHEGVVYNHLGDIYYKANIFDRSLEYYFKALRSFEKTSNKDKIHLTMLNIGDLYLRMDQCDAAKKYLFKANAYFQKYSNGHKEKIPEVLQLIGISYGRCGSLDSALYYFERSLTFVGQPYSGIFTGGLLNNIGAIYSKMNQDEKALLLYNESLELFRRDSIQEGIGVSLSNIAYLYKKQKRFEESIALYLDALQIFDTVGSLVYLRDNYLNVSEVYELMGDFKEALIYNNRYLELSDSISNADVVSRMGEIQLQFELGRKEQEILIMDQKQKIADQKSYLTQAKLYVIIGLVVLLLLIGALLFRNQQISLRNSELNKKILEQQKARLEEEIVLKDHELEGFALRIVEKNDLLEDLKDELKQLSPDNPEEALRIREITTTINNQLYIEKDRQEFALQLDESYRSFFARLDHQYPDLTKNERRLCSLIALELSTKEIATILNITPGGVKKSRHRLRKKIGVDSDLDLADFIKNL